MSNLEPIDWSEPTETIRQKLLKIVERRLPADKTRDDTAWVSLNRIAHVFDAATLSQMRQSLQANGYEDFYSILIGGDDFGKPKVQAILDALHQVDPQAFTAERIAIMKDWGVDRRPRWTYEGFTAQPTIEDVDRRKGSIGVRTKWEGVAAVIDDKIHRGLITDWQQVVEIVGGD